MILKYLKTSQLSQIKKDDDNIEQNEKIEKSEFEEEQNFANDFKDSFNLKKSQERWKEEALENK